MSKRLNSIEAGFYSFSGMFFMASAEKSLIAGSQFILKSNAISLIYSLLKFVSITASIRLCSTSSFLWTYVVKFAII